MQVHVQNLGGGASRVPWGWRDSYGKTGKFGKVGDKSMFNPNQYGGDIMDFTCYHGNHSVESALTKIIKITKLCNFFSFVLVHSFFPIIIVDMLA